MKVTFLGTGTSQGIPVIGCECDVCISSDNRDNRLRSSIYIEHEGTKVVVDVGPDFRQQMLRSNVSELDAVLISHEHNDHVAGLDDLRPFVFRQKSPIPIYSLTYVNTVLKNRFAYAFSENPYPGAPRLELHDVEFGRPFQLKDLEILPLEVNHGNIQVLGFRFNDFAYITDANHLPQSTIKELSGLKVLVINALHTRKHHSHYNLQEAIDMVEIIKPEKAYITHLSHLMGKTKDWELALPSHIYPAIDRLELYID